MSASLPHDDPKLTAAGPDQPPGTMEPNLAAPALDPLTDQTLRQLEQSPPPRTWVKSLILLAVTIGFFAMSGMFRNSPANLALLIGILLFHETGHYLGMRWFNYQDVQMFFIPLFGAAVAGKRTSIEGYKEAIVVLLGPLPGIALACVLGAVGTYYDSELLRSATLQLLILNGFNLLPFMPLDGGRFLHVVLFSRQRHLEALFQCVTGILVALIGLLLRGWILSAVGVMMALSTRHTFRLSTLATRLRTTVAPGSQMDLSAKIPHEYAVPLIESARRTFPQMTQPQLLANTVRQVWERMHGQPPRLLASLVLVAAYVGGLFTAVAVPLAVHIPLQSTVQTVNADGSTTRAKVVRQFGRVVKRTELNDAGQPHGKYVAYSRQSGRVQVEGEFADGVRHGKWTAYDEQGQPVTVEFYRHGRQVAAPPQAGN